MAGKEYYGIDAPTVVRNLGLGGPGLIGISVGMRALHILPTLAPTALGTGIGMSVGACWMMTSSLWLKQRVRDSLLTMRRWRGDEVVLDVGCGRGLVAMGAARRVPDGSVKGIDLWQDVDLSANTPAAFLANAEAAGVAGRVSVDTGDARALPYSDASFDVIGSMTAIHNIPDAAGRAAAIAEMWRVLKPGGQMLIFDIRHARTYLKQLRALGAVDTKLVGPILLWGPIGWRFAATKP